MPLLKCTVSNSVGNTYNLLVFTPLKDNEQTEEQPETSAATQQPQNTEDTSCVICRDRERNALLVPCGHYKFCLPCANKLVNGDAIQEDGPQEARCPLCNDWITLVQKVF